jgi:outer membrane protein assembly factor BamD
MRMIYLIPVLMLLSGCSTFGDIFGDEKHEIEEMSPKELFTEAREALKEGYYTKAVEHYEKLQARYPFGNHSQQAQLDLAYAYYKNDEPESAIAAANRFIKLYPHNTHVDYAYYLRGLANFNQGKGLVERYLPVDASQRDQGPAMQSFQDFTVLVRRFPKSRYVPDAHKRMTYLRNLLAKHEVHVANYYMRRGAYVAAANRARYVVENYQRSPAMPEALVIMAKAYRILELPDLANDALRVLERNYPDNPGIAEAKAVRLTE